MHLIYNNVFECQLQVVMIDMESWSEHALFFCLKWGIINIYVFVWTFFTLFLTYRVNYELLLLLFEY